ncbi:hypothetical protein D3C76_75990 [compost metagenome]
MLYLLRRFNRLIAKRHAMLPFFEHMQFTRHLMMEQCLESDCFPTTKGDFAFLATITNIP